MGKGDINRMYRLCLHYDRIQSERDSIHGKSNKRKRYKLRRCMLRIHKKIRNLVDECHRKFARWLCENHHVVLLPEFKTKNMVKRGFRKIHSKTARQMMTWSHYRFRQYLLHKSREYPWCKVVICTEEYTSKTCGCCGVINRSLGSLKTFQCPSCGATIDRDVNGARNVLLKYITENKSQLALGLTSKTPYCRLSCRTCVLTYRFDVRGSQYFIIIIIIINFMQHKN